MSDRLLQWTIDWIARHVPDQATRDRFGRELIAAAIRFAKGSEGA